MKRILIFTIFLVLAVAASGLLLRSYSSAITDAKQAPDFNLTTTDGKPLRLSDYKGKGVIVNFWATWCPPCRAEIPDMIELQEEYGPKGFSFIGIALGDDEESVKAFVTAQKINYPVAVGTRELAMNYGRLTLEGAIRGIPTSFVINAKGEVIDYFIGARSKAVFAEAIRKALTEK